MMNLLILLTGPADEVGLKHAVLGDCTFYICKVQDRWGWGASLVIVIIIIIIKLKIHGVLKGVLLWLLRGFFLNGLNATTVSDMCKFPTVSASYMVAFVWFFGIDLIFSAAEWAFLPSVTNTFVSSFLSFGFVRLKTILPI